VPVASFLELDPRFNQDCAARETGLSPREDRLRRNEDLFREVNAHIAELEDRFVLAGEPMPLICERANTGCATVIGVEQETYRAVRENPLRFLAPGHEADGEVVVERGADYLIVEKEARD